MNTQEKKVQYQDFRVCQDCDPEEDFFRVITPQGEVQLKKLLFQKTQPLPETISCRVKGYNADLPVLGHNMPSYINEFYADGFSRGQEFEFKVIGKPYDSKPFYLLEDSNGVQIKLRGNKAQLSIGQNVKCRFEHLSPTEYILRRSDADSQLRMLNMRDLGRILDVKGWMVDKIDRSLREIPELGKAIEELDRGLPSWIFTAMRQAKSIMHQWFKAAMNQYKANEVNSILNGCRTIALHMLEGSNFMRNIKGTERASLQNELTAFIEFIDIFLRAHEIIASNSQEQFIDTLLRHLKESGYIYHPTSQFAILMILFRINPELVNSSLGNIFDTLMDWYPETWKAEPFRQAFVEQLEIYIREARQDIDNVLKPETTDDNQRIEKVLTAIAIQKALAVDTDNIDMRRNMSLFYRCLSSLRSAKADVLLQKSYLTLMGVKLPTDFTWTDIKEPTMMMTRAAVDPPQTAQLPQSKRYYPTENIDVEVSDEGICICLQGDVSEGQVPNGMLAWPGQLQVRAQLDHPMRPSKMKTIDGHADFWQDVETALFHPKETAEQQLTHYLRSPEVDDEVRIIIDRVIPMQKDINKVAMLHCKIVDEHYAEGTGLMEPGELVGFNLHGISIGTFRNDQGEPLVFNAIVNEVRTDDNDHETVYFSLAEQARNAVYDLACSGMRCNAVITKDNGDSYSAISDRGFGLFLRKEEDVCYRNGNVVMVEITEVSNGIAQGIIEDGPLDGIMLNNAQSLRNLLRAIAVNDDYDDLAEDLELDEDDLMMREDMLEIIQLLRYKAISEDDLLRAFDYLSYARLLAKIVGDETLADTLKAHKGLLMQQQQYAKNKQIFADQIQEILQGVALPSPLIKRWASKLLIVASMGDSEANTILWEKANGKGTESEKELAQMVLSYNMLYQIGHDTEATAPIKEKIAKALKVNTEQKKLKYYGSENQRVEFKSSLVYPAAKGKAGLSAANPDVQEYEILHIIAGFMNTSGGTLYIGVSDDHYERGLDEDLSYYEKARTDRNIRRHSIRSIDNIANYLQQLIDEKFNLGHMAGEYAKASPDDDATKGVVKVEIKACPRIVYFDDKIFVRHGSKTTPYKLKEEIEQFIAERPRLYEEQMHAILGNEEETPQPGPMPKNAKAAASKSEATNKLAEEHKPEEAEDDGLRTSALRTNVLHDYTDPDRYEPVELFLRFTDGQNYMLTNNEYNLDEDADQLILAIKEHELDQYLVLVYEGELALKVPMRELQEKSMNQPHHHFADRKLLFACPMSSNDGLYSIHINSKGTIFERYTPLDAIEQGSMTSAPMRLVESECACSPLWELVPARCSEEFSAIRSTNMKRAQLGAVAKSDNNNVRITPEVIKQQFYDRVKLS